MALIDFIHKLDKENQLVIINEFINPELEITEIVDRISKSDNYNKALLFNNNGTIFPILINAFGNDKRILLALNSSSWDELINRIGNFFNLLTRNYSLFKKIAEFYKAYKYTRHHIKRKKGKCQEIIYKNPNLNLLPILKCWPFDGGKFITLPIVHTLNPQTKQVNAGVYRLQVLNENTLIIHWHIHKDGAHNYTYYKEQKIKIPVAIVLGGNPIYTYCATAPLPSQISEYFLASFLLNKQINFVKCLTQEIYVPDDADIVIEGYIDPNEKLHLEGPFGDHTGFYSLPDYYPIMHVTAITHRKNAIYPAIIVGIPPQEDYYFIKATEAIFKPIIKLLLPEIIDIKMPFYGVAHNLLLVQIKDNYPAHSNKIAHFIWGNGQLMFTKVIIVTDINIKNEKELFSNILLQTNIEKRIFISYGPSDVLEHASEENLKGGKLLIDATKLSNNIQNIPDEYQLKKFFENMYEYYALNNKAYVINVDALSFDVNSFIKAIENIKIVNPEVIIFIKDKNLKSKDYRIIIWHFLSNFDPVSDCIVLPNENKKFIILNGIPKFKRKKTPNPVIMNEETIELINKKWHKIFPNIPIIPSPSKEFKNIFYGNNYFVD
ncbi:MAG: menaquinone biosynthesis decarboxylase [Bacteroidales bacterium]|nr:menaquinone biosynthesis decarboxylase [Bacteroidales bacterium]